LVRRNNDMTEDNRRDPTPEEAYNLQFGIGGEEYLRMLRSEVKSPNLLGTQKVESDHEQPKAELGIKPKHIVVGLIGVVVIIAAIIGHTIASGSTIRAGDCVITNPSALTNWDIKKVDCSNPPQAVYYQVASVQNGSGGDCGVDYTTFRDDPASKTYCLTQRYSLNTPGG